MFETYQDYGLAKISFFCTLRLVGFNLSCSIIRFMGPDAIGPVIQLLCQGNSNVCVWHHTGNTQRFFCFLTKKTKTKIKELLYISSWIYWLNIYHNSVSGIFGSCIVVIVVAIIHEAIKSYQAHRKKAGKKQDSEATPLLHNTSHQNHLRHRYTNKIK